MVDPDQTGPLGSTFSYIRAPVEKYVSRDHRLSYHSASLEMPIGDPRDGFFYPTLTHMIMMGPTMPTR